MNEKICFVQHDLRGGGAERKVCTLANYFALQGRQVEIGLFGNDTVAYKLDPRIRLTVINRTNYEYKNSFEKAFFRFKRFLTTLFVCLPAGIVGSILRIFHVDKHHSVSFARAKKHYDHLYNYEEPINSFIRKRKDSILITMMAQTYIMVMDVIATDVRKGKIQNPYLVMECNNPTPGLDATDTVDKKRNVFFPLATKCVVMNTGIRDYFNDEIRRKCVIIPNPVRSDLPEPYHGERRKVIVNYCRLNRQKNLPLLISAFEIFHKKHPDYYLEIFGEGDLKEELMAFIETKGLSDSAFIYPFQSDIHNIIKDCMMYVSSSDWEGFPNSVMEALSIGLPVISTDCDFGPSELIESGINGILVKTNDVNEMADAMNLIATDEIFRSKISENAVNTRRKYDVEIIGNEWLNLIDSLGAN